jgi:hypothetical protein
VANKGDTSCQKPLFACRFSRFWTFVAGLLVRHHQPTMHQLGHSFSQCLRCLIPGLDVAYLIINVTSITLFEESTMTFANFLYNRFRNVGLINLLDCSVLQTIVIYYITKVDVAFLNKNTRDR